MDTKHYLPSLKRKFSLESYLFTVLGSLKMEMDVILTLIVKIFVKQHFLRLKKSVPAGLIKVMIFSMVYWIQDASVC